jgi:hypothetical protein
VWERAGERGLLDSKAALKLDESKKTPSPQSSPIKGEDEIF